jgi:hypothetical protein
MEISPALVTALLPGKLNKVLRTTAKISDENFYVNEGLPLPLKINCKLNLGN